MQIALAAHLHVDQRMASKLIEHVVKKTNTCCVVIRAGSIQIDGYCDRRFGCFTGDLCAAHEGHPFENLAAL